MSIRDTRPMSRLNISVIVEHNGHRESGTCGGGGRIGLDGLISPLDWQAKAREALRVAIVNLDAVPPPPLASWMLFWGQDGLAYCCMKQLGMGLKENFNRKGTSAFAGLLGKRIAAPGVTVLDDGTIPNRRGSISVDDEGTPSGKKCAYR